VVVKAQDLLKERNIDPKRIRMAGICSACAESFVNQITKFEEELATYDS
jgi:coenzyme F420-reducing hydrogenase delta subunit